MIGVLEMALIASAGVTLVTVVAGCVCGCRKDSHNELVGTAGVVKIRIEEEIPPLSIQHSPIASKRTSAQNHQNHRSLPDLPDIPSSAMTATTVPRHDSGDTASDLYATVGLDRQIPEETARQSSPSYEHEYARLQNGLGTTSSGLDSTISTENIASVALSDDPQQNLESPPVITASNAISGQVSSSRELPYMTPPIVSTAPVSNGSEEQVTVHQPNQHFSGDSVDSAKGYTSITVREPLSFIRPTTNLRVSQRHYTTVSDDSDEMYAAIEEPANQVYTSESETYAQIQPPNSQQTNNSVNVASISHQPPSNLTNMSLASSSNHPPHDGAQSKHTTQEIHNGQNMQNHIRQTSNSSHAESITVLGSPKPEKRQANSPLPPPPPSSALDTVSSVSTQHKKSHESPSHRKKSSKHHKISSTGNLHDQEKLRRSLNEKHQRNNSCVSSSDFYGCNYPVDKHRFSSGDLVRPLVAREIDFSFDKSSDSKVVDAIYNTIDGPNDIYAAIDQKPSRKSLTLSQPNVTGSPIKNVEEMYAKVIKKSKHLATEQLTQSVRLSDYDDLKTEYNANIQPSRKHRTKDNDSKRYSSSSNTSITHENTKKPSSGTILNVQLLDKDDPGYETIDKSIHKSHGYETINKNKAEKPTDPGYETVKELNRNTESKKSKNIPTVSGGLMQHSHNSADIMQRITHLDGRASPINEPGYETVASGPDSLLSNDPGYEHIRRHEKYASDSDPNYEQLRSRNSTPPYAPIRNRSSMPGYSIINKSQKPTDQSWASNNNDSFLSEPNYESMPHEPPYTTGSESDPNYESVGPKDPNYESVKYFNVSMKEPPYEKVKNDGGNSSHLQRNNSSSSYEKIKPPQKHEKSVDDSNDNRKNGSLSFVAENGSVSDYFQV